MLGLFKKKRKLLAPVSGRSIDINEVNDPVFKDEMLGKVVAIKPESSKIYSPVAGEVGMVFKTLHAIGLKGKNGEEILLHIGLDTVELNGEGFNCLVDVGDKVDSETLLYEVDFDFIESKGYDTVILMVLTNSEDYHNFNLINGEINKGETVFTFE